MLALPLWDLFMLAAQSVLHAFFQPLFYAVLFLIYWQCRGLADRQKAVFGRDNLPLRSVMIEYTAEGMLGGIFAGILVLCTGLTINDLGLEYLWPLAIILFLLNARFLCFAYAGGILALSHTISGWPQLSVARLLALVAILHITESLLILAGGRFSALPAYFCHKGKAVGGFFLANFWPLPLIMMFAASVPENGVGDIMKMPDWWPLFPVAEAEPGHINVLMPIPVVAALGYSSVAISCPPAVKRRISAAALLFYSCCLLAAAWMATILPWWGAVAAVLSFAGHEAVIYLDKRLESGRRPLYVRQADTFTVLDTIWRSPARRAGIKSGDILLNINGWDIKNEYDLGEAVKFLNNTFTVKIKRGGGEMYLTGNFLPADGKLLGVIRMPRPDGDVVLTVHENYSLLGRWWKKWGTRKR